MTAHIHVVTPSVLEQWERLVYARWEREGAFWDRIRAGKVSDDPIEIWVHVYVGPNAHEAYWVGQWVELVEFVDHAGERDRSSVGAYGWVSVTWCWAP